jgi:hypothetical protein
MARATYMLGLRLPVPERTGFVDSTLPQILLAQFFEFRFDQNLEITSSFFRIFYFKIPKIFKFTDGFTKKSMKPI